MVSRRRRLNNCEKFVTFSVTICCLPVLCTWGLGIAAVDIFNYAKNYERPKKRAERQEKENARALWRRNPTDLDMGPRLERSLTLPLRIPEHVDLSRHHDNMKFDELIEEATSYDCEKKILELDSPVREPQRTEDQLQSPLFTLPLEIRRQIYEEVLAGHVFHIYFVPAYRRLSHTRCKHRYPTVCTGGFCRLRVRIPGKKDEWGNTSLLHMLKSCRRIYSEAIEILYKENTFDFDSLNGILQLSRTILPSRMKLIKSVQWRYKGTFLSQLQDPSTIIYYHHRPWEDCCAPDDCSCVLCWAKKAGLDYRV